MVYKKISIPAAAVLLLLFSSLAAAGDFMDTRLTFTLSENNFFAGPGETPVNSPGFGIGADKSNTLFFDNYETRYSGFETLSHLTLYKKMPSFFDNLTTETALVVRFMIVDEQTTLIRDAGSYIRLVYDLSGAIGEGSNVEMVLFPISGDRFRLGYSYKISWGGSGIFPLNSGMVPAAKLQLNLPWGYGFVGFKSAQIQEFIGDSNQTEMVTNYGALTGLGVDISGLRAELNGGYFTRGTLPHPGVIGRKAYASGLSYQVGYHRGMDIGTSIDFALYKNDPDRETEFFKPEEYGQGLSFVVKHEGTFLWQTLMDPDRYGTTTNQFAMALDVNFALKWNFLRVHLDGMYRTLSFLLHESPSFTPFQDFPAVAETSPEYFVALGLDYHLEGPHLTPGLIFGVQMPATYSVRDLATGGMVFGGKRTVVVQSESVRSILPVDESARLIWSVKANCKWDISEIVSVIAEVYFSWDDNQSRFISDFYGLNVYSQFIDSKILGANLAAQARF
ncbi:MAG TPA: hypothetical protein VM425_17870 [Myxococcota bacterium]|nr:hypothetical protein [Myxococcota bacterium]